MHDAVVAELEHSMLKKNALRDILFLVSGRKFIRSHKNNNNKHELGRAMDLPACPNLPGREEFKRMVQQQKRQNQKNDA